MMMLEGIHGSQIDGEPMQLSSGFEDYFLSAQYFDAVALRIEPTQARPKSHQDLNPACAQSHARE